MENIILTEIKNDPDLTHYTLENLPLLKELKNLYLESKIGVCIERAKFITEYMKNKRPLDETMQISRAKAVNYYLANREPIFHDNNLIAGSTTSKPLGAPVYPELIGMSIWPELDTISTRTTNPQELSKEDANTLNFDIFPYWMDRTVMEVLRKIYMDMQKENPEPLKGLQLMEKIAFYMNGKTTVISHTIPYYEDVLHKGLNAMIAEADSHIKQLHPDSSEDDLKKLEFYESMKIAMQGILTYAKNLSEKAKKLAQNTCDEKQKKHYLEIADVCANVPQKPASNFREAVNSLWLCHVGILAENINMAMSPGRLDQVLYPFFKKDAEQNKINITDALTLIGCLWLKISDNTNLVPESAEKMFGGAGSVPAVTLGGIDKDGKSAVNDLTYLLLKITELMKTKDPNVNARYFPGVNSTTYRDRVIRVINNTQAIPALYNDITNIATLENQGVSKDHAWDYGIIGCVELASAGREYSSSSSILLNLTAVMDLTIYNGKRPYIMGNDQIGPKTGEPASFKTFDEFKEAFRKQLTSLLDRSVRLNEDLGRIHQSIFPTPLLSTFFMGPMEKGKDLIFGGALYNSSGTTHVGFADVCDSLNAIEDIVFNKKECSLEFLVKAVTDDFDEKNMEYQKLVHNIRNNAPKYGMIDSPSDPKGIAAENSKRLIKTLYDYYQGKTNYRGGKYRPAYWTMTNHAGLGKIGHALPSGRRSHELFSSGITPESQCTKDLTGAYLSVAKLDSQHIPGCVALNMKYTPRPKDKPLEEYVKEFADQVEAYFKAGGMQVQYNIRTYEDLQKAKKNPTAPEYRELLVRVSGYSAYFKDLNDAMKDELITRTQYDLHTGKAVPYSPPPKELQETEELKN